MRKYLFQRDTILSTLMVFAFIGLLSLIPMNTHILDPIKFALTDISFNDLSYKIKGKTPDKIDDKIVLVNIGQAERPALAQLINRLTAMHPKVIGLDILFESARNMPGDSMLASAIKSASNIVLSDALEWDNRQLYNKNFFSGNASRTGYVNFVGEDHGVIRYFSPYEKVKDTEYSSFAAAVSQLADENASSNLHKRNNELELINYSRKSDNFLVIEINDILDKEIDPTVLTGKIVIVGYINKDPFNIEDKHFTPMNERFVGKSVPDMNGAVIQANIISMIIDNRYISRTSQWLNWLFAIIFTWLFTAIIIHFYIERHIWFHLVAKLVQLVLAIFFIYIGIVSVSYWHVSINFAATLIAIIISVDVLHFYEGITNWLHKTYGLDTVFVRHHHKKK